MTSTMNNDNKKFNYEALIRKVKLYPAIFDPKHEMHRNRAHINELWRQIAESLRSNDVLCREKWTNIRSNYMRETRKLQVRRIEGKPLKITWPYFHLLEFLNPTFHRKISNDWVLASDSNDDERLVIDWKPEASCQDTDDDEFTSTRKSSKAANYDVFANNRTEQEDIYSRADSGTGKKRRTWRDIDLNRDLVGRLVQEIRNSSEETRIINEDKDRLFLLSLLPFMKQLNSRENLEFRMEIQQRLLRKFQNQS